MHILVKKLWALAVAIPVAALVACTTDAPEQIITPMGQVIDADEYNELVEAGKIDEMGNVIEEDEDDDTGSDVVKSSSSKAGTSSAGGEKATSSSDKADPASSSSALASSAGGDTATSSAEGDKASSSSGKVEPASSATPASSGTAPASSSATTPASSSSAPASSATPASSSAVAGQTTIINSDGNDFNMGQDAMKEVSETVQTELDSLKEILDNNGSVEGFEKTDMEFNEETLPYEIFDTQDFFCFTGEGEWLQITRELLGKYIPHYKNGAAWGNLRHFDVKFMDACAAVYIKRK